MATVAMTGLTVLLIIVYPMIIKAHFYTRKSMYVPEKERTERIPNLSPAKCMEQCEFHRFCKAVGMDEKDHEDDRITTCFLLSRKPTKEDKEKEGSTFNLSVMYKDEDYSDTIDFYFTRDEINYPVHGSWGIWGIFTACNVTCDNGYQIRERKCDDPTPSNGGFDCYGASKELKKCSMKKCSVNGNWAIWPVSFGDCTKNCGGGRQYKTRWCNNPLPENNGGLECLLSDGSGQRGTSETISQACNTQPCKVNGNWENWPASFGACSESCGVGGQYKTRRCMNPKPSNGGLECLLSDGSGQRGTSETMTQSCNTQSTSCDHCFRLTDDSSCSSYKDKTHYCPQEWMKKNCCHHCKGT